MCKSAAIRLPVLLLIALLAVWAPAAAEQVPPEMQAQVPELWKFHEVIYQLWHKAWPEKDYAKMKKLLPRVRTGVQAVAEADLPGILRDKRPKWEEGVEALKGSLSRYEGAIATGDKQGMLDATEELHARFEQLVRIIRPATKEIDAYHVELYKVYHYHLPGKDLEGLRETSEAMVERCVDLESANLPRRLVLRFTSSMTNLFTQDKRTGRKR